MLRIPYLGFSSSVNPVSFPFDRRGSNNCLGLDDCPWRYVYCCTCCLHLEYSKLLVSCQALLMWQKWDLFGLLHSEVARSDSIRLVMLFLKDLLKWTTLLCLEQQQLSCRKSCRAFAAVCQRMPWVSNEGGMVSDSILLLLNLSCMPVTSCIGSHNLGRTWEQALKGRRRCAETRIL